MAETISSRSRTICIKGFNPALVVDRLINGSDIKPGHYVTNYGEANNSDVDLCEAGEPPLGVALEHHLNDNLVAIRDTPDIDTLYTDNATVRVALMGSGMVCLVWLAGQATTTAVYGGTKLIMAGTGKLALHTAITFSTTTAELGADVTNLLAAIKGFGGMSIEYDAGGSLDKVIAVMI